MLYASLMFVFSCFPRPPQDDYEEINLDKALLDLPQAVNAPEASSRRLGHLSRSAVGEGEIIDSLKYIFNPVRDTYNPLAAEAIRFTRLLLADISEAIFQNKDIMRSLHEEGLVELTYEEEDTTHKARLTKNGSSYAIEAWKILEDTWFKFLDLRFAKEGERYYGTIYTREEMLDADIRPEYRFDFDTQNPTVGHSMQLSAVNLNQQAPATDTPAEKTNIPTKLWLNAQSDNETFYIAGNVYYENINIETDSDFYTYFMSVLNEMEQFIPGVTVVNGNYIYRGAVDLFNDRGAIDLALVPEAVTGSESIFTDYSIGKIYEEAIAEWIRNETVDNSTVTLVQAVNLLLAVAKSDVRISAESSTEEIMTALEIVLEYLDSIRDPDARQISDILFIVQIVNPGYFDSENGFVGNDEIRRPDWADTIPGYETLQVKSAAEVSSDNFTVVMPDDENPDF